MDDLTYLNNGGLIDTVSGWISHHQCSQFFSMLLRLGLEVGYIDIALVVTSYWHNLKARHHS